jgi:2-polyprenyl-3-methyl-5-hydroxy-6-metoxy-1,4-benzoquinol methylase
MSKDRTLKVGMQYGKHDINDKNLRWAIDHSDFPDILKIIVNLSRKNFRFFNKTLSRSFEYPYIINEISQIASNRILDVGAGLSPLPLLFAERGIRVVTVDNSLVIRKLEEYHENWNGWGFFDYGSLNKNITSINNDIAAINFAEDSFDCIYSVSVIEHIAAANRRQIWGHLRPWLKKCGMLLLTIDLIPETDFLWNYNAGKLVEDVEEHGNIGIIQHEIVREGFTLDGSKLLRKLPQSKVDVALLKFSRR